MNTKICPKCGRKNPIAANFCRHCRYKFSEESKQGNEIKPIIKELEVMTDSYTIGSFVDIMWDVENATHISLNGNNVTNHNSYEHKVTGDETIELVAKNDYTQTSKKIKLKPKYLPKIIRFTPSRRNIKVGEDVNIHIDCRHTKKILLQSNISREMDVSTKKTVKVTPKFGEEYTLVCFSIDPEVTVTETLDLGIIDDVHIDDFSTNKKRIMESDSIILSWKVRNAQTVTLQPYGKDVTNLSSIELSPSTTTTYILKASNELNSQVRTISVSVIPLPRLSYNMPKMATLNFSKFNLPDMLTNIPEINIDKWMASPLTAKQKSVFKRIKDFITSRKNG